MVDLLLTRIQAGDTDVVDDLDEIEDRLLRAGYAAGLSSTRGYQPLPGVSRPVLEFLACPAGRCPRAELPGSRARCAVFAAPMTRTRLAS